MACQGCKGDIKDVPTKDLRVLETGHYIVSKVYITAMNPNGIIVGPFTKEQVEIEFKKFVFLKRLINPKIRLVSKEEE